MMLRGLISTISALAFVAMPVAAQAAPVSSARVGAPVTGADEDLTTTHWVLIAIGVGLLIWGIIELTSDDDKDLPTSP